MNCKNCSAPLPDDAGFCSYCGARKIDERLSTKFLLQEILDKVLSVDNKLLKTFVHLFIRPEEVINGYISGIRKRYYNPFSYLLISITISGLYIYFVKDILIDAFSIPSPDPAYNNTKYANNFMDIFTEYQAFFTVMNIPIYGFLSWLVFLNRKKYNFYEHLVIFLYAASHATIFSFIFVVPFYFIDTDVTAKATMIMSGLTMVYFGYVLIRLYKLTIVQFIIKSLYFIVVASIFFIIIGIGMNIVLFFYLGKDEYLKQFVPQTQLQKLDSIKEVPKNEEPLKTLDSLPEKSIDNIPEKSKKNTKDISFYEASSKLNCFS